jgi:hypothetical protein
MVTREISRRAMLQRFGIGGAALGAVTLLDGGGRAFAKVPTDTPAADHLPPATSNPSGLSKFGFMFPRLPGLHDTDPSIGMDQLAALALSMQDPGVNFPAANNRDNTESASVFTYLGQFIDHDLTLDLEPQPTVFFAQDSDGMLLDDEGGSVFNNESYRFDLSSVYGGGPTRSPQLYESDRLHFRVVESNANGVRDLPRNPDQTAILVEHRNDENEVISQVHTAVLKFHNAVVDSGVRDFARAAMLTRQHYQWIVVHEFLPHIIGQDVVDGLLNGTIPRFYKPTDMVRPFTPVEWSTAAYRFGHSQVRLAYQIARPVSATAAPVKVQVFNLAGTDLHGGRMLPAANLIDWGQFVPALRRPENTGTEAGANEHFNFPRQIDTFLSKSLFALPIGGQTGAESSGSNSLAFRNFVRQFFYNTPTGQAVAAAMGLPVISPTDAIDPTVVPGFEKATPLWYYILKESELAGGLRLGPTGGRIVGDVLLGLIESDPLGIIRQPFTPQPPIAPTAGQFTMADLLVFAGVATRP